jgi:hypothetical protein
MSGMGIWPWGMLLGLHKLAQYAELFTLWCNTMLIYCWSCKVSTRLQPSFCLVLLLLHAPSHSQYVDSLTGLLQIELVTWHWWNREYCQVMLITIPCDVYVSEYMYALYERWIVLSKLSPQRDNQQNGGHPGVRVSKVSNSQPWQAQGGTSRTDETERPHACTVLSVSQE